MSQIMMFLQMNRIQRWKGARYTVEDNRKKIQNLLENVMRASKLLMERGYLDITEGEQMIRCLMGIRQRFLSDAYMGKSPIGQEINEIDEMILPLDRMLVDAGKKGYRNTISYILKTIVQGAGIGHRILTAEEERNKALVLLKRKRKVQEYLDAIENIQKLDERICSRRENEESQNKESEEACQIIKDISDELTTDSEKDLISAEKILEMQKLIEKFVEEDGSSMVDFVYDEMERVFASRELNEYVANSLREFEELGLAEENLI